MKKRFRVLSLLLVCVFAISCFTTGGVLSQTIDYSTERYEHRGLYSGTYVDLKMADAKLDTPNTSNSVNAYYMMSYADATIKSAYESYLNNSFDTSFPNAQRISGATAYYNCHSFAWHSTNYSSNRFWIDYPTNYINDGSYELVTSSPQIGDIICYYLGSENKHSGIIVGISSSGSGLAGQYTVESKWGNAGLYVHNGYQCPYTNYLSSSGYATSIKIYRKTNHTHSLTYTDYGDASFHRISCGCGKTFVQKHNWVAVQVNAVGDELTPAAVGGNDPNYVPMYECDGCGAQTLHPTY